MINGPKYYIRPERVTASGLARIFLHLHLVKKALVRLHEYYVFWDGFGSLAAKTRGLVEHDRILNCEHRSGS